MLRDCLVVRLYVGRKMPGHWLLEIGEARLVGVKIWVRVKSCVVDCFRCLRGCFRGFFYSLSLFFFLFGGTTLCYDGSGGHG